MRTVRNAKLTSTQNTYEKIDNETEEGMETNQRYSVFGSSH